MKFLQAIGIIFFLVFSQYTFAEDINLGVLAPRGKLKALKRWTSFGDYLSESVGKSVKIIPLAPPEVLNAAKQGKVNFVLSHPPHTVALDKNFGAVLLATLNKNSGSQFAGVIIAKKGSGIKSAEDLKGRAVMSLKFKTAAGAYIFQTYHLKKKGIDVHKDFGSLTAGKKQDDLVLSVKAGLTDAAFIRSGLLEAMDREGKINKKDFVIVDQRFDKNFPLLHTTVLYPEWYLSSIKVDPGLTKAVKAAVLKMTPDMAASKKAKIRGFVKPLPLEPMQAALKSLKITPYN